VTVHKIRNFIYSHYPIHTRYVEANTMESVANSNTLLSITPILALTVACSFIINYIIKKQVEQRKSIFSTDKITANEIVNGEDCSSKGVQESITGFNSLYDGARKNVGETSGDKSIHKRKEEYKGMVDTFYNLVTDFYEW